MEKKKIKLWKKILIIIIILVILLLIHIVRNLIIINSISSKLSKLENSDNYKLTSYSYNGNNFTIMHYYFKNGKSLEKNILISSDGNQKLEVVKIFDGENRETYTISDDKGVNFIDSEKYSEIMRFFNELDTGSFWNNIIMATITRISSQECNGKKCYMATTLFPNDHYRLYYDKETGLMVRDETSSFSTEDDIKVNCIKDSFYEFDVVTDNDLIDSNISEYKNFDENK